jgi:hypothetical protein
VAAVYSHHVGAATLDQADVRVAVSEELAGQLVEAAVGRSSRVPGCPSVDEER